MQRTAAILVDCKGNPVGVYVAESRDEVVRYIADWPGRAVVFDARPPIRDPKEDEHG